MRGKWLLFAGGTLIVAAGAGALTYYLRQPPPKPTKAATAPVLPTGSEVHITGSIRAVNLVLVPAPVDGVAEEFPVKPGDEVFEGQILGRISNETLKETSREAELEVERAQARVNDAESLLIATRLEDSRAAADASRARIEFQRAERTYQRQQLLNAEGATPRNTYQKSLQDYEVAKKESDTLQTLSNTLQDRIQGVIKDIDLAKKALAEKVQNLESARSSLSSADLLAPADGLVISIGKSAGEEVRKGMPDLITIATDLSQLELVLEPEPPILKRLRAGQQALVQVAELPGNGLPSKVKSVDGGKVIVEFSSPSTLIRPGMTAVGTLKLN
ncbi:efflux RND transporter periplasmic adaptor subunit [uncultured Paludibaculum sp.]|uniref:HlyD family secretion protein n=1 Tax=uncultured Paludibaculum sp. TaxID=1765020 RepID=UPI002AABB133|nr:efflux RND transporter periplasmic adaptor subunit [uncultured Paludibaculum sp.]